MYTLSQFNIRVYAKFEFQIQIRIMCHVFNGKSVYTVSVYKIYFNFLVVHAKLATFYLLFFVDTKHCKKLQ